MNTDALVQNTVRRLERDLSEQQTDVATLDLDPIVVGKADDRSGVATDQGLAGKWRMHGSCKALALLPLPRASCCCQA